MWHSQRIFSTLIVAALVAVPVAAQTPLPDEEKAARAIRASGGHVNDGFSMPELFYVPLSQDQRRNAVLLKSRAPADLLGLLKNLKQLKTVSLQDVVLPEAGLVPLAQCKELEVVLLVSNRLTPRQVQDIAALKTLRIVGLRCPTLTDEALANLAAADNLEHLVLDADAITGSGLKDWGRLKHLRVLSLDCAALDESALAHLRDLEALEELTLVRADLTAEGVKHLAKLKKLRRLTLVCPELTDAGLKRLAELKELESLTVQARSVSAEAVRALQKALPPTKPPRFHLWHDSGSLWYLSDVPTAVLVKLQAKRELQKVIETREKFLEELSKALTGEELGAYQQTLLAFAEVPQQRATVKKWYAFADGKPLRLQPDDDEEKKLLKARYNAALIEIRALMEQIQVGSQTPDIILESCKRMALAGRELASTPAKQIRVAEDYVEIVRWVAGVFEDRYEAGKVSIADREEVRYWRADAELQLVRLKRQLGKEKADKEQ